MSAVLGCMKCLDALGHWQEVVDLCFNKWDTLGADTTDKKVAHRVEALNGRSMVSVACGQYHTIVATTDGEVYTCGKNDYGQLGLASADRTTRPTAVGGVFGPGTSKEQVVQLRCGYYHSVALAASAPAAGRPDPTPLPARALHPVAFP